MTNKYFEFFLLCMFLGFLSGCSKPTDVPPIEVIEPAFETPDDSRTKDTLRVATLNMFVGFNVPSLINSDLSTGPIVYKKANELQDDFVRSAPRTRLQKMAEVILNLDLDVVGMQEVTELTSDDSLLLNYPDYLIAMLDSIAGENLYSVHHQRLNTINFVAEDTTGDAVNIKFVEGNAILFKNTLTLKDSSKILYVTAFPSQQLMDEMIDIERGFQMLTLTAEKSGETREIQFFNTHLEIFYAVSKLQAQEFLLDAGALYDSSVVQILTGDINEEPGRHADTVIKADGFIDTWAWSEPAGDGATCCFGGESIIPASQAGESPNRRIDYIYAKNITSAVFSDVYLDEPYTLSGDSVIYLSDHAMVVSHIEFQY